MRGRSRDMAMHLVLVTLGSRLFGSTLRSEPLRIYASAKVGLCFTGAFRPSPVRICVWRLKER